MNGEFEQEVEIDDDFEKIVVPAIGDTRKATIIHDFNMVIWSFYSEDIDYSLCIYMVF